MKYLSDSQPDYRALEAFIASGECGELLHREKNALFHVPEIIESFEPLAKELLNQLKVGQTTIPQLPETLPTRYDNPFSFNITKGLVDRLKVACRTLGINVDDFPPFACIPTGVVNAYAANVPGSERRFLLFDSQVFFFCNLWAKILATAQPIVGVGDNVSTSLDIGLVRQHLTKDHMPVLRLKELLKASVEGSPSDAPPYIPSTDYVPLISLLRDSMELFVVAHEFGHVYSGHLGKLMAALPCAAAELLEAANDSQQMEYQADAFALLLTMQCLASEGMDFSLSYIGPYMFFSGLALLDRYVANVYGPPEEEGSSEHPSHADRQSMLNAMAHQFTKSPQISNALKLQESFEGLIAELESRAFTNA